jgi:predicted MFS family arabinose efflux permease
LNQTTLTPVAEHPRAGIAEVFRQPRFIVLWLSEAVSLVGDRILMVALVVLVYEQTHSAASVGLLAMIKALPALLLGTLAGVFVDRWSHKWTMVVSNLLQGLLVLLIPLTGSIEVIFATYLGMAVVSQFFIPARSATIPDLVPEKVLLSANSLFAMAFVGAIALGPAIGGWITERFGLNTAFYVDSLTFFVPALAVGCMTIPAAHRKMATRSLGGEWREGLGLIRERADIRSALILIGAAALQIASLSVLGILLASEKMGTGVAGFGGMMSFTGIGMLGGAILLNVVKPHLPRVQMAAGGAILSGAGMLSMALANSLAWGMLSALVIGLGFVTVQANAQTILQGAPENLRGRALGMGQAVMGSVTFLAAALAGLLAGRAGATPVAVAAGLTAAGIGLGLIWHSSPKKKHRTWRF